MSDYKSILYEKTGAVLKITLNRPDRFNAFNDSMHKDLTKALKEAAKDDEVRTIILTGAGKAFCSGQDLKEVQGTRRNLGDSLRKNYNPNILRIRKMEKPVICALNGVAAGAGMSLALSGDLRIASEKASLIEVFVNVALIPDSGSTWFLPRMVGYHRAFELCSTGRKVDAKEALELNLVDAVYPESEFEEQVMKTAEHYAKAPTKAIGLLKRALNKSMSTDLSDALDYEAHLQEICGDSEDYKEGVNAFVEKRKPEFKGK